MSTVYRQGGVSVTLTGDLAAWAEAAIREATNGASEVIQRELGAVAAQAQADWYGAQGVTRRTGQSGTMAVVTTVDASRNVVRFSVGSTDTRRGKSGMPVPNAVHRSGGNAAGVAPRRQPGSRPAPDVAQARRLAAEAAKAKGGDGKKILPIFVNRPVRAKTLALVPEIARTMCAKMEATRAG